MEPIENCTTCKHGTAHKYATGVVSGKILCVLNMRKNYTGIVFSIPIKCTWYEKKAGTK